jgi:heme-degrading monooxygenase HmoA
VYARSTTFKDRPEALEAAIAMVRDEVMPAVQEMQGCVGLSMLVDRTSGSVVVTTAWASQPDLESSAPRVAPLRDRAHQLFGSRPEVQVWEIAVLHRAHHTGEGACARVTWLRLPREEVDEQIEVFRTGTMPQVEELPGFCSLSLLVDRDTGRSALAVVYDSADALAQSRDAAMDLRADAVRSMSGELLDVAEFDVVLAHLRVPETV